MKSKWEYKTLGNICVSELGKTLNQSKDTGTLRPYLCAINIQWDCLNLQDLKKARFEDDELERYSVQKGDLLVCEGGDVGRAALWESDEPMLYQNALHRIRFSVGCYPRFYLFCLRHLKNKGVLDSRFAKGVTIKHLVKSSLLSIPVPVPPLDEQQRIVAELDLLTEVIDKRRLQLTEIDTLAQSIFYDMFGDPTHNEKGWDMKKLGDLCLVITKGTTPTTLGFPFVEEGINFVKVESFTNGRIDPLKLAHISDECHEALERSQLKKNDLMICIAGATIGKMAVVDESILPANTNQACAIVRLACEQYIPFIFAYLKMRFVYDVQNMGKGVAQPNLSLGQLRDLNVPLPPQALQQEFADKIQSIEKQKAAVNQSIAETQKLLDYTMDKYFG